MDQLQELAGFLECGQENVQEIVLENLLPYTRGEIGKHHIFKGNDYGAVKSLKKLAHNSKFQRNALSALVNLCDDKEIRDYIASDHKALDFYSSGALENSPNVGLFCMLLANLAHSEDTINYLLAKSGIRLKILVEQFVNDASAAYDYLAFLFGESARNRQGAAFWVGDDLPLAKIVPHIVYESVTRRAGVAATVKNTLFEVKFHQKVIESGAIEYIMVALKGPEPLDEEDTAKLPDIVKAEMGEDKKREDDPYRQLTLVECLLLLSSSREGRQALRDRSAYFIIRELHLATQNVGVQDACERFVNMVMRGEPSEGRATPIDSEDDEIIEVV